MVGVLHEFIGELWNSSESRSVRRFETMRSLVRVRETKRRPDWLWIGSLILAVISALALIYIYWAAR